MSLAACLLGRRDPSARRIVSDSIHLTLACNFNERHISARPVVASTEIASRMTVEPVVSTTARSMVFSSSRTLPGQWNVCSNGNHARLHGLDRFTASHRMFANEVLHQHRDVLDAFAKRRHDDRNYLQAVIEIVLEQPLVDELTKIAIRRRDHANVHVFGPLRAHGLDFALLQDAQQLALQCQVHGSDLVEKDRAVVGQGELAFLVAGRVRERSS